MHDFIKAKFVSHLCKLVVIIMFRKLSHKFLGLDQRLGQVSSNSENVQNLAILHGFVRAMFDSHLYKLVVIITLTKFTT